MHGKSSQKSELLRFKLALSGSTIFQNLLKLDPHSNCAHAETHLHLQEAYHGKQDFFIIFWSKRLPLFMLQGLSPSLPYFLLSLGNMSNYGSKIGYKCHFITLKQQINLCQRKRVKNGHEKHNYDCFRCMTPWLKACSHQGQ